MGTPAERKALLFFSAVLLLGTATKAYRAARPGTPVAADAAAALASQIKAADSARKAGKKPKRGKRAKAVVERPGPLDLDIATAEEIESLRHIGPALARRIVADRDSFGPFGSREGLLRVRGIGPSMVEKLDTSVTFSLLPRPKNTVIPRRSELPKAPRKPHRRDTSS